MDLKRKTVPDDTKTSDAVPGFLEALKKEYEDAGETIKYYSFGTIVGKMIDNEIRRRYGKMW